MSSDIETARAAAAAFESLTRSSISTANLTIAANQLTAITRVAIPNMQPLATISQEIQRSMEALRSVTSCVDVTKSFQNLSTLSGLSEVSKAFAVVKAANTRWENLAASIDSLRPLVSIPKIERNQFASAALAWDSGITATVKRLNELHAIKSEAQVLSRLLAPSNALSAFAEQTYSRMKVHLESREFRALNASLALANAQHVANSNAFGLLQLDGLDTSAVSALRQLRTPFVQQEELLNLPELDDEEDVDVLVSQSVTAQAAELARAVLTLVADINDASRVKGNEIFKPTTRVLEVFADLPWLRPDDRKTFADFIDCLHFLVYEAAGDDKLRFLKEHGGPLSGGDCNVIWCVKALRNKWLRHDPDHGKESDIERSRKLLGTQFEWLGLAGYPRSSRDFRMLHERLLREMERFLTKLFQAI